MEINQLKEFSKLIPNIDPNRRYWLIRTQGGDFYKNYYQGEYVAIGYDKISLFDVSEASASPNAKTILSEKVTKRYPDNKRPGHVVGQILRFINEIKKGDVVLIPSANSNFISFGIVQDSITYQKSDIGNFDDCPFDKRKKVNWIKTVSKYSLNPYLYRLLSSHNTISNADSYAEYIDKTTNSLFIKNGKAHIVVDVKTQKGINAKDFFRLGLDLFEITDEYAMDHKINMNTDDAEVKLDIQSPGTWEIISLSILAIGFIGMVLVICAGGKIDINFLKTGVKVESNGLLKAISNFLDKKQNRKIKKNIINQLADLEVESPEETLELLNRVDSINTKNNDESGETTNA